MIGSWIVSHLAAIAGFLLAAVLIAHIIRQPRPPTATIAWMLAIILIPYLGVPLFLLLGGRKMKNLAGRKARVMLTGRGARTASAALTSVEHLLLAHGVPPAVPGNRLVFHQTAGASYAALVDVIEGATQSIYISIFILHPDAVGRDILARLVRRASEGLRVRLLLDGVGSLHTHRRTLAPLEEAGGQFAFFMPVLHRPFRGRTNLRNHRKTVIADERRVLAGGANIASEYMGPELQPGGWHDLTFTLEGPAVKDYVDVFRSDWAFASGESLAEAEVSESHLDSAGNAIVQVVPSGPDVPGDPLYEVLLAAVFSARYRVRIVTPYFIPDDALSRAFILAAHRGIDVQILLPERSNHRLADIAGRSYLREIQAEGGRVLFYQGGMLHAKAVVCDDSIAILGSANIDLRSLLLNYEVAILVYSETEIHRIAQWMNSLVQASREGVRDTNAIGGIGEGLARLLAPQL